MSNDYTDLTDMVSDIIRAYIDEDSDVELQDGSLLDLDEWHTDDLLLMETLFKQALELRFDDVTLDRQREMSSRMLEEDELTSVSEYLDCGEEPSYDDAEHDKEAEYDDPLFIG